MATTAKVGIDIEVLGYEGAKAKMSELEGMMKGINGRKNKIKLEADLKNFEKDLRAKKAHKIKIQAEMSDVNAKLRRTRQAIRKINNEKLRVKAEGGNIEKYDAAIAKLKSRLVDLNGQKVTIQTNLDSMNGQIRAAEANIQRIKTALKSFQSMSLGQIFNKTASSVSHMGQAMQSAGNALTRMASPMRSMIRYMGFGAGFAAFNKVSEGLMSGFQRYDTMNNYAKSLKALGLDASKKFVVGTGKAQTAIENLNDAVVGLPTGLDEIVAAQKIYAGATGEMVKSTKLAIAANNTFLASATDPREQRILQRYFASLASGADLTTMQWDAMRRNAPLAMRAISEELGYASDEFSKFSEEIRNGTISGKQFLDAFIKVGTQGKIQEAANVMKTTFSGLSANVQNAFSRMGAGMLETLDKVFESYNGRNFIQNLLGFDAKGQKAGTGIKDVIDSISTSMQNWVKVNPNKIKDFIDTLKGVDWAGFGKGFAKGALAIAEGIQTLASMVSGKSLANIGKMAAYLMPLGSTLTVLGGLFKGTRHFFGLGAAGFVGIGRFLAGFGGMIGAGKMAKLGANIQKFVAGMKNFGKVKAATEGAETAMKTAAKKSVGLKVFAKQVAKGLLGVGATMAVPVIVTGGAMLAIKAVKTLIKDLGTITKDMDDIKVDNLKKLVKFGGIIGGVMTAIGTVMGVLTATSVISAPALGLFLAGLAAFGAVITGISAFASLFTANVKNTIRNVKDSVNDIGAIAEGINGLKGTKINLGGLKNAVKGIADAFKIMDEGIDDGKWYEESKTQQVLDKYGNMGDAIKAVGDSVDDMKKIAGITEGKIQAAKDNISIIFEKMDELYTELNEQFDVNTKRDVKGSERGASIVENVTGMLESITGAVDDIKTLADNKKLKIDDAKKTIDNLLHGEDGKGGIIGMYNDLLGAFTTDKSITYGTGIGGANARTETEKSLADSDVANAQGISSIVSSITQTLGQLRGAYDTLMNAETGLADVDEKAFGEVSTKATSMIQSISSMWTGIKDGLTDFADAEDMTANFDGMLSVVRGIKPIITEIATLSQELGAMGGGTETGGAGPLPLGGLPQLGEQAQGQLSLQGILAGLPNMMKQIKAVSDQVAQMDFSVALPNLDSAKQMITKIGDLGTHIQTIGTQIAEIDMTGVSSFSAKIQSLVTQISTALNADTIAQIQTAVDSFRTTVDGIFTALNADFSSVKVTVNIDGEVTGDDALVSRINAADSAIRSAVNSIKTSYHKHVTVNITASVSKPNLGGIGLSTGGMVSPLGALYRSKGGSIGHSSFPGKPRGTDTVPTWLTSGEYVHKKKAVDFWGIDFMRKINNMDVRGVMRNVSARAGRLVSSTKQTIINNNTYNNQQLTQNISTNNPNFAYRRSNRFVGAL